MPQLDAFLDNFTSCMLFENTLHELVYVNQPFLKTFDIPKVSSLLENKKTSYLFESCSRLILNPHYFLSAIEKIRHGQKVVTKEKIILVDGQVFEMEFIPVNEEEGHIGNIWHFRKIAENGIIEDDLCQFVLENCSDGIWEWNRHTNQIFCSKLGREIFGYEEDEIEGQNFLEKWLTIAHSDDKFRIKGDMINYLNGETPIYYNEHRIVCKNGKYKWIAVKGKAISRDNDGVPVRIAGTLTDISAHKKLEKSYAEALKREKEINELKSQFMSMAIHEFRTPLSIMSVTVDSLESYWDRMPKQKITQKMTRIRKNISSLIRVMEQVLNLSLVELGKVRFNPEIIDVGKSLISIVKEIEEDNTFLHAIKLKIPSSKVLIKVDKQMFSEVMDNLISNAAKYSQINTSIKIELKIENSEVKISVKDKGVGIPGEEADKIFNPFYRCQNVNNVKGSGLGLALSKQFISLHGGRITFQSKINMGTTFFVFLPK